MNIFNKPTIRSGEEALTEKKIIDIKLRHEKVLDNLFNRLKLMDRIFFTSLSVMAIIALYLIINQEG